MSFSYSGDPTASDIDAVRFEIGDTNEKTQLIQNEEIAYSIKKEGTVLKGAARCAEALAARFARDATTRTSVYSSQQGEIQKHFEMLAKKLRARAITRGNFRFPAMSRETKQANRENRDLNLTTAHRGMHQNLDANGELVQPCGGNYGDLGLPE